MYLQVILSSLKAVELALVTFLRSEDSDLVLEFHHMEEWAISNLGLIKAFPSEVEETSSTQSSGFDCSVHVLHDSFRWSLEEVELAFWGAEVLFDEVEDVLYLLS